VALFWAQQPKAVVISVHGTQIVPMCVRCGWLVPQQACREGTRRHSGQTLAGSQSGPSAWACAYCTRACREDTCCGLLAGSCCPLAPW
jgi:hypothetical protein